MTPDAQGRIFDVMRRNELVSRRELSERSGLDCGVVEDALCQMRSKCIVMVTGMGPAARWCLAPGAKRPVCMRGMNPASRGNLRLGPQTASGRRRGRQVAAIVPPPAIALEAAWGRMPVPRVSIVDDELPVVV